MNNHFIVICFNVLYMETKSIDCLNSNAIPDLGITFMDAKFNEQCLKLKENPHYMRCDLCGSILLKRLYKRHVRTSMKHYCCDYMKNKSMEIKYVKPRSSEHDTIIKLI